MDAVEPRVEPGRQVAADGGLARADLSGEQADAAQVDEMAEPGLGLAAGVGLEQLVGLRPGSRRAGRVKAKCFWYISRPSF